MAGFLEFDQMLGPFAIAAAAGYLLGSLPVGYLVARSRGVNIFEVGSRSPGATNVRRVLGRGPGNLVFFLDALKGAMAAALPILLWGGWAWDEFAVLHITVANAAGTPPAPAPHAHGFPSVALLGYAGLAMALVGHSFSCFTRFRGGKGVATAAGGLLVLMPAVALISAALWLVVFYSTRYVSLASMLAALSLPLLAFLTHVNQVGLWVTALIALFVVIRHRTNVRRLLGGTEKKFERRPPGGEPAEGRP
jgi:acyl phosphate:glycerol-3-phosphate acyltransferase